MQHAPTSRRAARVRLTWYTSVIIRTYRVTLCKVIMRKVTPCFGSLRASLNTCLLLGMLLQLHGAWIRGSYTYDIDERYDALQYSPIPTDLYSL